MADPNIIPLANHMLSSIQNDLRVLKDQQVLDEKTFQQIVALLPTQPSALPQPLAAAAAGPPSSPRTLLPNSHTIRPPLPNRKSIANSPTHTSTPAHRTPSPAQRTPSFPKPPSRSTPDWQQMPSTQLEHHQTQSQTNIPHVITSIPPPSSYHTTTKYNKKMAEAVYDYIAEDPTTDLTFRKGDMIEVTEHVNDDWWRGSLNGNSGIFPKNHVQL